MERLPHLSPDEELYVRRELHALAKMCMGTSSQHAVLFLESMINLSEAYRAGKYSKQALTHAKHALLFVKEIAVRAQAQDFHLKIDKLAVRS